MPLEELKHSLPSFAQMMQCQIDEFYVLAQEAYDADNLIKADELWELAEQWEEDLEDYIDSQEERV